MVIKVIILHEDFKTILQGSERLKHIEVDDELYHLKKIAKSMNCPLLASIEESGNTVFSHDQWEFVAKEIQCLRDADVKQDILDLLAEALGICIPEYHVYLTLVGCGKSGNNMLLNKIIQKPKATS